MAVHTLTANGLNAIVTAHGAAANSIVKANVSQFNDDVANPSGLIRLQFQMLKRVDAKGNFEIELLDKNGDSYNKKLGPIGGSGTFTAMSLGADENAAAVVSDGFVYGNQATFSTGTFKMSLRGKIDGLVCELRMSDDSSSSSTLEYALRLEIQNNGLVEIEVPITYIES